MSHSSPMLTFPALQRWLGKELEVRGVDAVIYTRYILSILQQDHFEVETDPERDLFATHRKEIRAKGGKRQQKRRRSSWTSEDLKKNAVLECLQSVTGEECGIESLVEELCVKLKKVQEEREKKNSSSGGSLPGSQSNSPREKYSSTTESGNTTPVSQAERYYEAFPALSDKTNLITTPDSKPQGAWGSKGGKGRSRSPRDTDSTINTKDPTAGVHFSKSASVSRCSTSPTHNYKKHYRTNSLPDNVSDRYESPVFLVPKYQAKKSNHGNGHHQHHHHHHSEGKASTKHSSHNTEKIEGRKTKNGKKQKNGHHTLTSLKSGIYKSKTSSSKQHHTEDSSWYTQPLEVPSEQLEDNLHNSKLQTLYKAENQGSQGNSGDISLEEAVSSLAESLCRDIMDDYNGDLEELPKDTITKAIKSAAIKCGKLMEENEGSPSKMLKLEGVVDNLPRRRSAEDLTNIRLEGKSTSDAIFGTSLPLHYDYEFMLSEMHQTGSRVWSVDSLGVSGDPQMGGGEVEGQSSEDLLGSASFLAAIWQKDPMPGNSTDPWSSDGTSNQLRRSSPSSQVEAMNVDNSPTGSEGLQGDDDPEKAIPLQVMVDEGSMMVLDGGATTTHLPIGTGRSNETLLRICSPTHTHHHSHDGTFCSEHDEHYRSFTSWSTGDGDSSDLQCVPPDALTPEDIKEVVPHSDRKDSLSQGIKAACDLPGSLDGQTVDVNNALWATYEAQPRFIQPPKIVRWEDGLVTGEPRIHRKKGPFIEGGVYGSPYNSRNNSHYSSCSTSPADSSIRDLWERSASQEGASLLSSSLQRLLSPKLVRERLGSGPLGESTPQSLSPFEPTNKSIDEKSVIEDSLVDSPVFMGSRSSSRFDFARSMSDAGEGSSSPGSGTETDEMVSEAEFIEEVMKETGDIRELTENLDDKCNNEQVEWSTNTGSLPDVDSTPQNLSFGLNQDFQVGSGVWGAPTETSIESGMLTSIKPVISKPEPVRSSAMQPDPAIGRPQDMFRGGGEEIKTGVEDLLISPKTHFRPIHEGVSPDSVETEDDTPRNVQLGNMESTFQQYKVPAPPVGHTEWPLSTGESGSLYRPPETTQFGFGVESTATAEKQWQRGGRWLERELAPSSQFTTLESHPLAKGKDTVTSTAFGVKRSGSDMSRDPQDLHMKYNTVRDLPRDRGPAEPWDTGGNGGTGSRGGGSGSSISGGFLIKQKMLCGAEFDPTVTTDYDQQIFPYDDEVFLLEEGLMDDPGQIGVGPAYYSSDLEQQWMKESEESVIKPPAKKRKPRGLRYRPCSFFLEGNCRRAGCRFAHDLSRIPCCFWEEGQCLKEEDCPFLHGYPSGYSSQEGSRHPSGSESLSREDEDEQMVPEGLNKAPSISKPKPPAPAEHQSPAKHHGLVSGGTSLSQPVPIPAHLSHHGSGSNNNNGSGSSNGKPPRSLPIQIVAKTR